MHSLFVAVHSLGPEIMMSWHVTKRGVHFETVTSYSGLNTPESLRVLFKQINKRNPS